MKVSAKTITRTIVSAIVLINTVLVIFGITPFDIDETLLYDVISGVLAILTTVDVWWKNNSFTKSAIEADAYKKSIKEKK